MGKLIAALRDGDEFYTGEGDTFEEAEARALESYDEAMTRAVKRYGSIAVVRDMGYSAPGEDAGFDVFRRLERRGGRLVRVCYLRPSN